ncbi:MAG: DUF4261 domain-containing protein [Polyangiaceae bacterium]
MAAGAYRPLAVAMPLFTTAAAPTPQATVDAWKRLAPDGPPMTLAETGKGSFDIRVAGRSVLGIHIGKPIPSTEAIDAVSMSWMWKGEETPVREHQSHAIVTAPGVSAVDAAWDVTRVCAAMLAAAGPTAAALYWGAARQVHRPELAIGFGSDKPMPLPLWMGITISAASSAGPFSAATHGLEAFGHREFEIIASRTSIGDIRSTLFDAGAYVLKNGPILVDGQTFDPDANTHWKVTHEPSKLVPGRQIICLQMP